MTGAGNAKLPDELEQLVRDSVTGDLAAYCRIVRRFQDMVYGYARATLGDAHLAEDASQEAFVHAYQRLPELRQPAAFPGWLRRIVWTQCDRMTRDKRIRTVELAAEDQTPSTDADPAQAVAQRELVDRIRAAIEALSAPERQATTLFYIDGYSYADISTFLDVPVTTVKSRLHAARQHLSQELLAMVKPVVVADKPGPEMPGRVVRQLIRDAKAARAVNDYERLRGLCDQALETLDQLKPSHGRQTQTTQLLTWRGDAGAYGRRDLAAATVDYAKALELAIALDDVEAQFKATRCLIAACGSAGNWAAVRRWAERGLKGAGDDEAPDAVRLQLRRYCQAAADLAQGRRGARRPDQPGGFALGALVAEQGGQGWSVQQAQIRRASGVVQNLHPHFSFGTPLFSSALTIVHPVLNSMPRTLKVDAERQCEVDAPRGWACVKDHALGRLTAKTKVEAKDQVVKTPAGRFTMCWKLTTTISPRKPFTPATSSEQYLYNKLTGTVTTWLAPGVGVVRVTWESPSGHGPTAVVLTSAPDVGTDEPLPTQPGATWQYQWVDTPGFLYSETCRVVESRQRHRVVTCAVHCRQVPAAQFSRWRKRTLGSDGSGRSDRERLSASIQRGPTNKQDPVRFYRKLGEQAQAAADHWSAATALTKLAVLLTERDPDRAEQVFAQALDAGPGLDGDAHAEVSYQSGLIDRCLHKRHYAWAGKAAERLVQANDRNPLKDDAAHFAGLAAVSREIARHPQPFELLGYAHAYAELPASTGAAAVGGGSSNTSYLGDALDGRPWWMCRTLAHDRLLLLPPEVGQSWSDSGNFGDGQSGAKLTFTRTLEAVDAGVRVPAGVFKACVRVRTDSDLSPYTPTSPVDPALLGWVRGIRHDWYAPGVGLVRMEHQHANDQVTLVELTNHTVKGAQRSYLPTRIGNHWQYRWVDGDGRPWGQEVMLVASRHKRTGYLAWGGYWFK